jgi:hypothetical protein
MQVLRLLKLDLAMAETDVKKAEDEVAMKKCEVVTDAS